MTPCPCCGQSVDTDDLLVSLETNRASRGGLTTKHMSPQQAEILWALRQRHPETVSYDAAMGVMYGRGQEIRAEMPNRVMRVNVSRLRRIIAPLNVGIINRYGDGYALDIRPCSH